MPRSRYAKYRSQHAEEIAEKRRANTKWGKRSIVAWDGEGCNLGSNQLYVLLANSRGEAIVNRGGLTTVECLSFLTAHAKADDINVIFGGSYDANMWLADLPRTNLAEIWKTGKTRFAHFYITYQWRKRFTVTNTQTNGSAVIWDVLGFFQTKFVDTVRLWLPEVDVTEMEAMKEARPTFDLRLLDEIIKYNAEECRLLVRVCENLFAAFDVAGIRLNRYDGAGAIAAALMRARGVQTHKGVLPASVLDAARYSYAGGRIEAPRAGKHDGRIYRADINSAYPAAIRFLPCLAPGHGRWVHTRPHEEDTFYVSHVRWSYREGQPFYPFFYRTDDGRILFPREGEGWCWNPELQAALNHKTEQDHVEVLECYAWRSSCNCKVFDWVQELYDQRYEFKKILEAGDPRGRAELPIKLGINSLYGKMAQQAGWESSGKPPTFHCLPWAGFVTSYTRAKLYDTAMQVPGDVIAFATDAIISTAPLELEVSKQLGDWSLEEFDGIVMVQPGVYFLREVGKDWASDERGKGKEAKYRGFDKGTLDRDGILRAWQRGCGDDSCPTSYRHDHYHATCTRFVGAGSALASPSWYHHWRTWRTEPRMLSLEPGGKRRHDPRVSLKEYASRLVATLPEINHDPSVISAPYPLAWMDGKNSLITEQIGGVDIDVIEKEWIDTWM